MRPLFPDALTREFEELSRVPEKLMEFHDKISRLKFLDPACGNGNFLHACLRELKALENDLARELSLMEVRSPRKASPSRFYGIELDEEAVKIRRDGLLAREGFFSGSFRRGGGA
ncbi:MAG: hypothetical protein LBR53_09570 [Deltaproteobacteria bacterium]|jgi:type II restriction/modification system DNA methylase subunit YeeA|nr:hypothetical protein [Deltaproteobacteria bacterium]